MRLSGANSYMLTSIKVYYINVDMSLHGITEMTDSLYNMDRIFVILLYYTERFMAQKNNTVSSEQIQMKESPSSGK